MAAPGVPSVVITNAASNTVSWTDLSNNETGFMVERRITPTGAVAGAWTALLAAGTSVSVTRSAANGTAVNGVVTYADTLLAPVVQGLYEYRVSAVKQTAGVTTLASLPVAAPALVYAAPVAPTSVKAVAALPAVKGSVVVTWVDAASNETGFSVQYSSSAAFTAGRTTVSKAVATPLAGTGVSGTLTLTGLTSGTTYYVRVAATNGVGTSAYSPVATVAAP
jgi:hypothetical protein